MFEFFFTLTAFYLAYIAYDAYNTVKKVERGEPILKPRPPAAPKATSAPAAAVPAPAKPAPAAKPAPVLSARAKASAPAAEVKLADELRNPATGEVSPAPANYRFAKKWIKDALVSEKLLDRVYKPSELDEAASKRVKEAIDKLRATKKYQA
jgi:hypothetical protein